MLQRRENGIKNPLGARPLTPGVEVVADGIRHQATFRGHKFAVYCVSFDKSGRRIITGSDDYLVKIWCSRTGLLLRTCRGHESDVTDLSVSCRNEFVASGSNDHTIRVWNMKDEYLGYPVATLLGHLKSVTFLDFHPIHPYALLSSSFDGTLRIWDISTSNTTHMFHPLAESFGQFATIQPSTTRHTYNIRTHHAPPTQEAPLTQRQLRVRDSQHARQRGQEQQQPTENQQQQQETEENLEGLLCCLFSPDGQYIVAGSNHCNTYIWHWAYRPQPKTGRKGRPRLHPVVDTTVMEVEPAVAPQEAPVDDPQPPAEGAEAPQGDPSPTFVATHHNNISTQPTAVQMEQFEAPIIQRTINNEEADGVMQPYYERFQAANQNGTPQSVTYNHTGSYLKNTKGFFGPVSDFVWDGVTEVVKFSGHKNDISLVEFSHDGKTLATGSKDGTIRIYHQVWIKKKITWVETLVITCQRLDYSTRPQTQRQRRRPPDLQQVTQLSHSADDKKIIVAVSDQTIRVYDSRTGLQLRVIHAHSMAIHVLECSKLHNDLAFSAGYDGMIYLWNIATGEQLQSFDTRDTYPGAGGKWPSAVQICDGHFSPDGDSIIVSDVAGQFHLYGLGPGDMYKRTPCDQFFASDYNPISQDSRGFMFESNSNLPAYLAYQRDLLCDFVLSPYEEPFQSARKEYKQLMQIPYTSRSVDYKLPSGLSAQPPTVTAAAWHTVEHGEPDSLPQVVEKAHQDFRIQEELNEQIRKQLQMKGQVDDDDDTYTIEDEQTIQNRARLQRKPAQISIDSADQTRQPAQSPNDVTMLNDVHIGWQEVQNRGSQPSRHRRENSSEGGSDYNLEDVQHDVPIEMTDDDDVDDEQEMIESEPGMSDDQDEDYNQYAGNRYRAMTYSQSRGARRAARSAAQSQQSRRSGRRPRKSRKKKANSRGASKSGTRRSARNRSAAESEMELDDDEFDEEQGTSRHALRSGRGRGGGRGRKPQYAESEGEPSEGEFIESDIVESDGEGEGEGEQDSEEAESDDEFGTIQNKSVRFADSQGRKGRKKNSKKEEQPELSYRPTSKYSWLQQQEQISGLYIPQCGDEVVFLQQGHNAYRNAINDKRTPFAGLNYRDRRSIRKAEPCLIKNITYVISNDGNENTVAKVKLQFNDILSPLKNTEFDIEIPHPLQGYAEFVILKSLYDKAVTKQWKQGELFKTCQLDAEDEEATQQNLRNKQRSNTLKHQWWHGTVFEDRVKGNTYLDPYDSDKHWERYLVEWDTDDPQDEAQSSSPWEMYAIEDEPEKDLSGVQHDLDYENIEVIDGLLQVLESVKHQEEYQVFMETPRYKERFMTFKEDKRKGVMKVYNKVVPLPLSISDIIGRVRHRYYRSLSALTHDLQTIIQNAILFHGEDSHYVSNATMMKNNIINFIECSKASLKPRPPTNPKPGPSGDLSPPLYINGTQQGTRSRKRTRSKFINQEGELEDSPQINIHIANEVGSSRQQFSRQQQNTPQQNGVSSHSQNQQYKQQQQQQQQQQIQQPTFQQSQQMLQQSSQLGQSASWVQLDPQQPQTDYSSMGTNNMLKEALHSQLQQQNNTTSTRSKAQQQEQLSNVVNQYFQDTNNFNFMQNPTGITPQVHPQNTQMQQNQTQQKQMQQNPLQQVPINFQSNLNLGNEATNTSSNMTNSVNFNPYDIISTLLQNGDVQNNKIQFNNNHQSQFTNNQLFNNNQSTNNSNIMNSYSNNDLQNQLQLYNMYQQLQQQPQQQYQQMQQQQQQQQQEQQQQAVFNDQFQNLMQNLGAQALFGQPQQQQQQNYSGMNLLQNFGTPNQSQTSLNVNSAGRGTRNTRQQYNGQN